MKQINAKIVGLMLLPCLPILVNKLLLSLGAYSMGMGTALVVVILIIAALFTSLACILEIELKRTVKDNTFQGKPRLSVFLVRAVRVMFLCLMVIAITFTMLYMTCGKFNKITPLDQPI